MRRSACVALAVLASHLGGVELVSGLGGPAGFGTLVVPRNDDGYVQLDLMRNPLIEETIPLLTRLAGVNIIK